LEEFAHVVQFVAMALYSSLLLAVLLLGAPYWLVRMATSGRYRVGLDQRLGRVPSQLQSAVAGKQVVWIHAVSVGEVLAATRLVGELEAALGEGWSMVISTTTATGQALAQERFGADKVFYYPLDLAWAVRAYLRTLQPRMLVLMESELWPRMLVECQHARIPVAVVNARVSDRSFARGMKLRYVWGKLLDRVTLFLAQSDEDARRLAAMGAHAGCVLATGNLKYDVRAPQASKIAEAIRHVAAGRPIVVAGSTVDRTGDKSLSEDEMVIEAWEGRLRRELDALLVIAPRHPQRFAEVEAAAMEFPMRKASTGLGDSQSSAPRPDIILLDTIGDLAAVYSVADVAFVGGSLVKRGGHNPLEPAQFGVPIVMGASFENFRDIVANMQQADAIRIVQDKEELEAALFDLLTHRVPAAAMGMRARTFFTTQSGATGRTGEALLQLVKL
jgi:3-deoxy-D-manno-octulosonic-acid transferase